MLQLFSLKESVQSTRIEGTQVTFTGMLECEDEARMDSEQREVLNYQRALKHGVERTTQGYPITTRLIEEMHRILMEGGRDTTSSGGAFRKIQNFIGPDNKIEHAVCIPVSADKIDTYMENLEFFLAGEKHRSFQHYEPNVGYIVSETADPMLKMAVMHAQFESIHPFCCGQAFL